MSNRLALRIAGTKQRQAGFAPLVNIGILPEGEGQRMDRSPKITDNPAFVIKHTASYILYLLIDCRVKSFDAAPSGVLSIALAVPRDVQLAGGRSPYSLLMEVYERFRAENMTPMNDGRYSFIDQEANDASIRAIVENYAVEPRRGSFVEMSPTGPTGFVCVPPQHLEAFFRDTQYPEFRPFRDIEVGVACQPSPELELLDIPRVTRYAVYQNAARTNRILTYPEDRYESDMPSTSTHEYDKVSFTLQELLDSPGKALTFSGGKVRLDEMKDIIYCEVNKREIQYSLRVVMDENPSGGRQALLKDVSDNKVRLKLGDTDVTSCMVGSGSKAIPASAVSQPLRFSNNFVNGYKLLVKTELDSAKRLLVARISYDPYEKAQSAPVLKVNSATRPSSAPSPTSVPLRRPDSFPKPPKKKGLDIISMAVGALLGLLVGCGIMYLVMSKERGGNPSTPDPNPVNGQSTQIESTSVQELKKQDEPTETETSGQVKDNQSSVLSENTTTFDGKSVKKYSEDEILDAINDKNKSWNEIKKMLSNSNLPEDKKNAVAWALNGLNLVKPNKNNKYVGNNNKDYNNSDAQIVKRNVTDIQTKRGNLTWEVINEFHRIIKQYV